MRENAAQVAREAADKAIRAVLRLGRSKNMRQRRVAGRPRFQNEFPNNAAPPHTDYSNTRLMALLRLSKPNRIDRMQKLTFTAEPTEKTFACLAGQ